MVFDSVNRVTCVFWKSRCSIVVRLPNLKSSYFVIYYGGKEAVFMRCSLNRVSVSFLSAFLSMDFPESNQKRLFIWEWLPTRLVIFQRCLNKLLWIPRQPYFTASRLICQLIPTFLRHNLRNTSHRHRSTYLLTYSKTFFLDLTSPERCHLSGVIFHDSRCVICIFQKCIEERRQYPVFVSSPVVVSYKV